MSSSRTRFLVFAAFIAMVFLMGGGSRNDIQSLAVLRPASAFFAAYALTVARPGEIARMRGLLLLLAALAVWMVLQLIPLPHALWSALPGRDVIAAADRLAGLESIWRPISLSPSKTINSLASLVVPVAGVLLFAVQPASSRARIPHVLLIVALVSGLLGIAQIATGAFGPLYLYKITNNGAAVGLFANRNHQAVFLGAMLVMVAQILTSQAAARGREDGWVTLLAGGAALVIIANLLINGSRAGLVVAALALGIGAVLYASTKFVGGRDARSQIVARFPRALALVALAAAAVAAAMIFSQSSAVSRMVNLSLADELRVRTLPLVLAMLRDNWLFGIGFGTFDHVFGMYESGEVLQQTYFNNAHDDLLQWVIEGGLPAVGIAVAAFAWLGVQVRRRWRERATNLAQTRIASACLGVLVLLLLASALDYPVRVPSIMLLAVLMAGIVADPPLPQQRSTDRRNTSSKRGPGRGRAGVRRGVA